MRYVGGRGRMEFNKKVACLVSLKRADMPCVSGLIFCFGRWCLWHLVSKDPTANCSLDKNLTGLTPVKKMRHESYTFGSNFRTIVVSC